MTRLRAWLTRHLVGDLPEGCADLAISRLDRLDNVKPRATGGPIPDFRPWVDVTRGDQIIPRSTLERLGVDIDGTTKDPS